ncbi:glycosyltransferase family 1 protein [Lysobacter hankyongensis]|uniref:Glycosyltransferase family 1 protein n=1 Tax=Lysobacter hankyongensis TaxID=1176535 RepID=A0ABP9CE43_9GAMM
MRYAIVTETWPPEVNGVALTVQSLDQGLRERGHDVMLVRPRQARGQSPAAHERLIASLPMPRYPGLRLGLPSTRRLISQWHLHRPDAIYVATEGPLGWSALRAARRLRIPAATGFHTRFDDYMRHYGVPFLQPMALAWMRRFHNRAQATLVPTEALRGELHHLGFANAVRLPRAVDTDLFHPRHRDDVLRAQWGLRAEDLAVIHLGRIAPEKNLALAVRAFREIQRDIPKARFVWVGDGPARAQLQRDNPDFVFCGIQRGEALARHFASADLFLFPSRSETYGNVTLEAMASGVPTVAFDYGAAHECLRDGEHGAAVADGHAQADDAFVRAALRIATDTGLRAQMRMAARDAVSALRPTQVAADFDAILQRLAQTGIRDDSAYVASPIARE